MTVKKIQPKRLKEIKSGACDKNLWVTAWNWHYMWYCNYAAATAFANKNVPGCDFK